MLALLLTGCSLFSGQDGTYLMTVKQTDDSCYPESVDGSSDQMLVSLYRTGDSLFMDLGGALLVGERASGGEFELSFESGYVSSYDGCTSETSNSSVVMKAAFTPDLGFEGNVTSSSTYATDDCPDTDEETCTETFRVEAIKLNAAPGRHTSDDIAWGYFSGGY
jgi:hypothetical protein